MKKRYNFLIFLLVPGLFLLLTSETMYPTGSPGNKTGSPGDNFANCTNCHTGTPTNVEEWIFSPELTVLGYIPGQTYTMMVMGHDADASKYGFEATAEDDQGNKVGSFTAGVFGWTQTFLSNSAITHTAAGTIPLTDTAVWIFSWTAPPSNVGDITFYAAVNAANGNGSSSGDHIYLTSTTSSPSTGIFEHARNTMNVYPNPSDGRISITPEQLERTAIIEVMDLSGKVVYSTPVDRTNNKLDLSGLKKGIYLIRAGSHSQKIIIR